MTTVSKYDEHSIPTLIFYFISAQASSYSYPSIPANFWDLFLKPTLFSINHVIASHINLAISTYTQIYRILIFNNILLAPFGCYIILHNQQMEHGSWNDRNMHGFIIFHTMLYYRNYNWDISTTKWELVSDTLKFIPYNYTIKKTYRTIKLSIILVDLFLLK